jgi:hypothetical protein
MKCNGDKTQMCGAGNRLSVVVNNNAASFGVPLTYNSWSAYGCLSDAASTRTLANLVSLKAFGGSSNATIENCLDACRASGYTWCGEEYQSECYGAKKAPDASFMLAPASGGVMGMLNAGCNMKCFGNGQEACGGANRLIVYSTSA